ncbi:MAG: MBG domain-containing protein, partial [Clostridiales bacterium]|nr:MBG domain-containing protein [Clostridiales bacterium]
MKGTQKRVIAFVLSLLLLFTAACGGGGVQDRTVRVALEFSEAADGKLEFEYSGVERVIAVSTGGENVAYEVAYLAEDGAALPEQPVNAGNYRVRAEVAEDGYSGDVEIPFIILKKQIENLTVTAPDGRFVPGMVFDPAQWLNPSALPEGVGVENVDVEYAVGDGELFTADKPEQPGIYTVRYKIAAQNYSGECSVEFAIRADAEKDLQFANTNVVYDGTPKAVTVNGLGSHDYYGAYTVTYDGSSQPPVDAGEYDLRAVVHVANASDETIEGKLTIQKKNVTINVGDKYFEYTEEIVPDFELSGSAPLPDKSDVRITYTVKGDTDPLPPATAPTEKGEYTVKFEVTDPNFKGGATATYRINARTGKGVTWNGLSQSYNGAPLAVTYELAG